MQRDDDREDVIKVRLKIYHQHAQALLDYYVQVHLKKITIDGSKPLEEVFEHFKKLIGQE